MEFNEILTAVSESDKFEVAFDTQHRLVARTKEPVEYPIQSLMNTTPFQNTSFITVDKPDIDNIIDMLNDAIDFKKSGTREDEDVEVFGERAISYERLFDYMGYVDYTPPLIGDGNNVGAFVPPVPIIITADANEINDDIDSAAANKSELIHRVTLRV